MKLKKPVKRTIYLDHASTTPLRKEVLEAMKPFWQESFANPSSLHRLGVSASAALLKARMNVGESLGARHNEIIFTAGGTESVNLAILGAARASLNYLTYPGHIIVSSIEHHAVLEAASQLEKEGFTLTQIGVDKFGCFDLKQLKAAIRPETILVSLMYANNEIGTIEPIAQIGKIIQRENQLRLKKKQVKILFHTDACQAAGFLDLNINRLKVDLMSLNGSKIYGPKQVGCLYVRSGVRIAPLVFGGGQEQNLRSGTENVAGCVGFAKALELAQAEKIVSSKKISALRDYCIKKIFTAVPSAELNGPVPPLFTKINSKYSKYFGEDTRLPNNINFYIPGVEGESLVIYLDAYNIAASTGSACAGDAGETSHVLKAIGRTSLQAKMGVRFTLGKSTTKSEINYLARVLPLVVELVCRSL